MASTIWWLDAPVLPQMAPMAWRGWRRQLDGALGRPQCSTSCRRAAGLAQTLRKSRRAALTVRAWPSAHMSLTQAISVDRAPAERAPARMSAAPPA